MRHFTLVNSSGVELDITTKEILFHEIGGLGFEEENDFRQIGDVWWLNHTGYNQATVSGKVIFTEEGTRTPYEKYWDFVRFIAKAPLTLKYSPYGEINDDDANTYYRRVRVSKLDKTEITTLGVLDCDIEFICYTPWYRIVNNEFIQKSETGDLQAWFWGNGSDCPPLIFEPTDEQTATRAKFRDEDLVPFVKLTCASAVKSPAKLTIYGPATNITWLHEIERSDGDDVTVGIGGFSPASSGNLAANESLVIDATNGSYSITKYNANGTKTNLYQYRDFNKSCFITLREGMNRITVLSSGGTLARHFELESHLYYATV